MEQAEQKSGSFKARFLSYYEKHETKLDVLFFVGGFLFDIVTLSDVDDPLSNLQQALYLLAIGSILYFDFLERHGAAVIFQRAKSLWPYRGLIVHFLLGSLLSLYSLFFLKSASVFSSVVFVVVLAVLMIANEFKFVRESKVDLKTSLYLICVFSFLSILYPVALGFVGLVPFLLALLTTAALLAFTSWRIKKRGVARRPLLRELVAPSSAVLALLAIFYVAGWIPPVPLSVQWIGIYHKVEKSEGSFLTSHENPVWKFWNNGDQDFRAEPGDRIYVFTRVFSPGRFADTVILHWYYKDPRAGWQTTDRVPMKVTGGRRGGYRGFAVKQNYSEGDWRVSVETTDGREMARLYVKVSKVEASGVEREFETEWH